MKFSQRIGITPIETAIQIGTMDEALRNSLWSLLTVFYWDTFNKQKYYIERTDYIAGSNLDKLFKGLWLHYFKQPIDTIPQLYFDYGGGLEILRKYFFLQNGMKHMTLLSSCLHMARNQPARVL